MTSRSSSCGCCTGTSGKAALEFKLDGARIQVHKDGDEVRAFSRNLRDVTHAVPEVVEVVRAIPAEGLILDGEVLALHPDGSPQPFQTTMRRFGRKLDVERLRDELPLTPFFFDLLYCDGHLILDEPQASRFATLRAMVPARALVRSEIVSGPDAAHRVLAEALAREIARDDYTVFVRPELVVEIAFNDIQISPRYPGGVALRFARVKRYRPDKPAAEADTFETVRAIHRLSVAGSR